ncbi:hypothetical protein PVAP13_2NG455503 [Panicum virgatum]|uniref:Uncharacterized protein n=1 Tax=Panicum virgatum TaxID=38727 RepID=A0A8T0VYV3_PANVG|nr:hypothetical protein PVAP13_2NG455503 [Panicum virgatum]
MPVETCRDHWGLWLGLGLVGDHHQASALVRSYWIRYGGPIRSLVRVRSARSWRDRVTGPEPTSRTSNHLRLQWCCAAARVGGTDPSRHLPRGYQNSFA